MKASKELFSLERAYDGSGGVGRPGKRQRTAWTNDERTAKRISDMLGTTTEQRNQKNYTGHRLAPWHIQLSRGHV